MISSLSSSHSLGRAVIFSFTALMPRPTPTAAMTMASTPLLLVKALTMLLGTALTMIIRGLEPVAPVEAVRSDRGLLKAPAL